MGIYAISGILMIFCTTDFLKLEKRVVKDLPPNANSDELGRILKIRDFKVLQENDQLITFKQGQYVKSTGKTKYFTRELPVVLSKIEQMRKATVDRPLFFSKYIFRAFTTFLCPFFFLDVYASNHDL